MVTNTHEHCLQPYSSCLHTTSVPGLQLQRRIVGQLGFSVAAGVVVVETRVVAVVLCPWTVVARTHEHSQHPSVPMRQSGAEPGLQLQGRGVGHSSIVPVVDEGGLEVAAAVDEPTLVEENTHRHCLQPYSSRDHRISVPGLQLQRRMVGHSTPEPCSIVVVTIERLVVVSRVVVVCRVVVMSRVEVEGATVVEACTHVHCLQPMGSCDH